MDDSSLCERDYKTLMGMKNYKVIFVPKYNIYKFRWYRRIDKENRL